MEQKFKVGDTVKVVKGGNNASDFNRRCAPMLHHLGVYSLSDWRNTEFKIAGEMETIRHDTTLFNGSNFTNVYHAYPLSYKNEAVGYVYKDALELVVPKQVITIEVPEGYKIKSQKVVDNQVVVKLEPIANIVVVSASDTIIKLKPEYIEKLKELGVYDKWLSNLKAQSDSLTPTDIEGIERTMHFSSVLIRAFEFSTTPEGRDYWSVIAKNK